MNKVKGNEQNGFVSIIVAALIMVILALITIGFTRIMQREQRQALDRQLSRQALYAAESGVNDVLVALRNDTTGTYPDAKTDCSVAPAANNPAKNGGVIDGVSDVAYTCVLYDRTPNELVYDASPTESKIIPLETVSGANFSDITISWGNSDPSNNDINLLPNCGSSTVFPSARSNTVPVLKIDLTNASSYDRNNLIAGTEYLYAYPCKTGSGTTHTFNAASRGDLVEVQCTGTSSQPCSITIDGLSSSSYISRVKPIYASASVTMTANAIVPPAGTAPTDFKDAQYSIDVTAKASDVIRRLRVNVPYAGVVNPPESVFQAFDGVCKLLSVDRSAATLAVEDSCNY